MQTAKVERRKGTHSLERTSTSHAMDGEAVSSRNTFGRCRGCEVSWSLPSVRSPSFLDLVPTCPIPNTWSPSHLRAYTSAAGYTLPSSLLLVLDHLLVSRWAYCCNLARFPPLEEKNICSQTSDSRHSLCPSLRSMAVAFRRHSRTKGSSMQKPAYDECLQIQNNPARKSHRVSR